MIEFCFEKASMLYCSYPNTNSHGVWKVEKCLDKPNLLQFHSWWYFEYPAKTGPPLKV